MSRQGEGFKGTPRAQVQIRPKEPQTHQISVAAVLSLVFGILGMFWVTAFAALVAGYMAKHEIDRSDGKLTGRWAAVAGIILGWTWLGLFALYMWALTLE